jgi:phosphate/sulfate permease
VREIVLAWVLTLPAAAALGALSLPLWLFVAR